MDSKSRSLTYNDVPKFGAAVEPDVGDRSKVDFIDKGFSVKYTYTNGLSSISFSVDENGKINAARRIGL